MASIESASSVYIRVYKRAVGNPAYVWSNTYEMGLDAGNPGLNAGAWQTALQGVIAAERPLHSANVEFVKATVGTWVPEPRQPYDPSSFAVYEAPAGTLGTRVTTGEPLPRRIVLHVKKAVATGRSGKLFLRGCLHENDLVSTSTLDFTLLPAAKTSLDTALTTMYNAIRTAVSGYNIIMASELGAPGQSSFYIERAVLNFEARGITTLSDNHAYYDRNA